MSYKILDFVQLDSSKLIDEAVKTYTNALITNAASGEQRKLQLITDATHSGKIINDRVYPGKQVKDSAKTFFKNEAGATFDKPFLKNHDQGSEPIGRVVNAEYNATLTGTRWMNDYLEPSAASSGFLRTTSHIMDQDAITKFLDKRYQTVSISAVTDAAFCDKCTKAKGELVPIFSTWVKDGDEKQSVTCGHWPGEMADGSKNYLITGKLNYRELSQVNNPADDGGIHVGMELLKDQMADKTSFMGMMGDKLKAIEVIKVPVYAEILDAQGKSVKSLNIKDYIATKTISIPNTILPVSPNQEGGQEGELSSQDFAEARLLNHFNKYHGLQLTDGDKMQVSKLHAKLTEDQKKALASGFYLTSDLPFTVADNETVVAAHRMADRLFVDKVKQAAFLKAVVDQAKIENITTNLQGIETMDEKQTKVLLDSLEASKTKVASLEAEIADLKKNNDELLKAKIVGEVEDLISLRIKVGYADVKDFDKNTEEQKTALRKTYSDMSAELRNHMIAEATANVAAGVVFSTKKLEDDTTPNPLTVAPNTSAVVPPLKVDDSEDEVPSKANNSNLL